ncbi:sulfate transporter [Aeromonas jandaei]|uniref:DUF3164 family protein n=1 Tax=Aeromonas TaxID=642 RepID=UPI000CE21F86|nr:MULTISPECIES: DUF3164 family protein [Aeromonas]PPA30441.1 sulfate transporter [Aeromonas jandaei]TNI12726.1 sulfate transporter [Aeromonas veronii]
MTSHTETVQIPEGYRQDAKGRLIPESAIKPIDLERDKLVIAIVEGARVQNDNLTRFKAATFGDIEAFVELSAEQYGAKVGGKKGNVSLLSFDGRYRVDRAIQDTIKFDERLLAAKTLIDECLHDWTADSRAELKVIVNDAFRVDTSGEIRAGRVLALRRYDFKDERWLRAMQAVGDAVQVTGSKTYLRVYERIGDTNKYRPISLDIATV